MRNKKDVNVDKVSNDEVKNSTEINDNISENTSNSINKDSNENVKSKKPKKKKSKLKIALIVISSILTIAIIAPVVYINIILDRVDYVVDDNKHTIYDDITFEPGDDLIIDPDDGTTPDPNSTQAPVDEKPIVVEKPKFESEAPTNKDIVNILLIGVEKSRPNENGRSDSMIIATFDKKNKQLKLTSILRDNYVYIPGHVDNRINASFAIGNAPLLLKTIKANFNISIDKYVTVDFEMFKKIVNRIGNVNIYLTDVEAEKVIGKGKKAGSYSLNAAQTLKYSRLRKTDSDFTRTSRQRKVLTAIYNKCMSTDIFTLMDMLYDVLPYVQTNLTKSELINLMTDVFTMGKKEIQELRIPVNGMYKNAKIRGALVLVPDYKANAKEIRKFIYGY